ncbi:Photoreceptor Cilium Actin Regulator [Manis pentadactyla]|nr:Photoreceptor Cilium Actin Regulator [Manis pentadactyla]
MEGEGVDLELSSPPQDGQLAHLTSASIQPPAEKGEGGARLRSRQPDGNIMHGICWELRLSCCEMMDTCGMDEGVAEDPRACDVQHYGKWPLCQGHAGPRKQKNGCVPGRAALISGKGLECYVVINVIQIHCSSLGGNLQTGNILLIISKSGVVAPARRDSYKSSFSETYHWAVTTKLHNSVRVVHSPVSNATPTLYIDFSSPKVTRFTKFHCYLATCTYKYQSILTSYCAVILMNAVSQVPTARTLLFLLVIEGYGSRHNDKPVLVKKQSYAFDHSQVTILRAKMTDVVCPHIFLQTRISCVLSNEENVDIKPSVCDATEFRISVVSIADDTEVFTELPNVKGLWDSIVSE